MGRGYKPASQPRNSNSHPPSPVFPCPLALASPPVFVAHVLETVLSCPRRSTLSSCRARYQESTTPVLTRNDTLEAAHLLPRPFCRVLPLNTTPSTLSTAWWFYFPPRPYLESPTVGKYQVSCSPFPTRAPVPRYLGRYWAPPTS